MIIQKAPRRSLSFSIKVLSSFSTEDDIASQYLCIAEDYASRVNIHVSRKIMHHESISMHRRRSYIASQYPCIAKDHASQINIYASRKHASRVNIHASRKIMHHESISMHHESISMHHESIFMHRELISKYREKISYLAEIYASREDSMPRCYASREDFIPRRNLCIARRFHTSQKFMHHDKIPCLVEIYAY